MTQNDSHYGSSHYRQFKPISETIKSVEAGTNRNPTAKQHKTKFKPEPPGVINRGDRSQTIWMKKKSAMGKGDSIATIETSSIYEADSLEFENPDREYSDFDDDAII